MLCNLLDKLHRQPLKSDDMLVFLGDYVDRGENTRGVLDTLIALKTEHPNCIFLRGNHESMMLEARAASIAPYEPPPDGRPLPDIAMIWLHNGGMQTLNSYGDRLEDLGMQRWWHTLPPKHWEFIETTDIEYITDRYHFVHAGIVPPGETWTDPTLDPRMWIREPFLRSRADFDGRVVVFGHTPQRSGRPLIHRNKVGLDTAAVFGGPLTAAVFDPEAPVGRKPRPRLITAIYDIVDEEE